MAAGGENKIAKGDFIIIFFSTGNDVNERL